MDDRINTGLSDLIKEKSYSLGFDLCGIAASDELSDNGRIIQNWCEKGMNDNMTYLCRDIKKRINPDSLLPGAKSLIVTGLNYYTDRLQKDPDVPVVSRYAFGSDYHDVISVKLHSLLGYIKSVLPGAGGKVFVDSAPLLEKPWAVRAGLGWQGKNSVVINEKIGSFFFIGIIVLDAELPVDQPYRGEKCGSCSLCIEKCPTGAINDDRTIDARRCIANLTIENREPVAADMIPLLGRRVYGCDICQEVCPWNNRATPNSNPELTINDELANMKREQWLSLTKEQFDKIFTGTPVERVGYGRFKRNIDSILTD